MHASFALAFFAPQAVCRNGQIFCAIEKYFCANDSGSSKMAAVKSVFYWTVVRVPQRHNLRNSDGLLSGWEFTYFRRCRSQFFRSGPSCPLALVCIVIRKIRQGNIRTAQETWRWISLMTVRWLAAGWLLTIFPCRLTFSFRLPD